MLGHSAPDTAHANYFPREPHNHARCGSRACRHECRHDAHAVRCQQRSAARLPRSERVQCSAHGLMHAPVLQSGQLPRPRARQQGPAHRGHDCGARRAGGPPRAQPQGRGAPRVRPHHRANRVRDVPQGVDALPPRTREATIGPRSCAPAAAAAAAHAKQTNKQPTIALLGHAHAHTPARCRSGARRSRTARAAARRTAGHRGPRASSPRCATPRATPGTALRRSPGSGRSTRETPSTKYQIYL